jgi:hypothetical protein
MRPRARAELRGVARRAGEEEAEGAAEAAKVVHPARAARTVPEAMAATRAPVERRALV